MDVKTVAKRRHQKLLKKHLSKTLLKKAVKKDHQHNRQKISTIMDFKIAVKKYQKLPKIPKEY